MHELSITENILEIVLKHAKDSEAKEVKTIHLVIGQLSSVVDDCVQFYWDIISKDTIAEHATLNFKRVEARLECQECHHHYDLGKELQPCPNCGSCHVNFIAGTEFYLESIDIT